MIKELEDIGLTKKEAQVYVVCLKNGASSAFKIAKHTSMPTTTVYNTLKKLASKGLVSTVPRRGKKYYEVNDPSVLKNIKEQELDTAQRIIPALSDLYMGNVDESQVKHFTEQAGIKSILDEMLEEATELMVLGSVEEEIKYFEKYFPRYIKLRVDKRIPARHIAEDSETVRRLMAENSKELRNMKVLPASEKAPAIMYLWHGRVVVISLGDNVRITSIKDMPIYQMMKRNFDFLWEKI